jgi:hypothetical protein
VAAAVGGRNVGAYLAVPLPGSSLCFSLLAEALGVTFTAVGAADSESW